MKIDELYNFCLIQQNLIKKDRIGLINLATDKSSQVANPSQTSQIQRFKKMN